MVRQARRVPPVEDVALDAAAGRVLAEDVAADRDSPAVARSVRDGYAVRASDLPGELEVIGEVRAGERFAGEVGPRPGGRDHDRRAHSGGRRRGGDGGSTRGAATAACASTAPREPHQFINPRGCEAAAHEVVLRRRQAPGLHRHRHAGGVRPGAREGLPRSASAISATGDEIVEVDETPAEFPDSQFQRVLAGGAGGARRRRAADSAAGARHGGAHARRWSSRGLEADLLLLSGGVSAGKYDVVEQVLAGLAREFYFDRVLIQPGQPLVFGRARASSFSACRAIRRPPW